LWSAIKALPEPEPPSEAKRPSKQDEVIAMLRRPEGATVDEVARATGWQRHTVRGVFSDQAGDVILGNGSSGKSRPLASRRAHGSYRLLFDIEIDVERSGEDSAGTGVRVR